MIVPDGERTEERAIVLLSLAAIGLGLIGAVAAYVLYHLILLVTNLAFYQQASFALRYPPTRISPWMVLIPAAGGLVVGLISQFGTERIRGHGIPEAMEAIITKQSRIDASIVLWKPISAAIAVGTGGPFGAEGPIIQTGGGIGSLTGQWLHLTPSENRVFLACGAAAGMVGIFNTPISAVALAIELLLFEFRPRSLIPVIVASATAAAARPYLMGSGFMFAVPPVDYGGAFALPFFVPLGVLVGLAAVGISKGLFLSEQFFDDILRLPRIVSPAVGGLLLGLIALVEPRVLGMGYPLITSTITGQFEAGQALLLGVAKTLALWMALGSGTSGGLLAPLLLVGGSLGSAYGQLIAPLSPAIHPDVCAIVAMSALFGAAARIPVTSFLFGFELTGDYHAIVPLMIGCMVADIVARLLARHSVMTERLAHRGIEVPRAYVSDVLTYLKVEALLRTDIATVPADATVAAVLSGTAERVPAGGAVGDADLKSRPTFWIVTEPDGTALGMLTLNRLVAAQESPTLLAQPVRNVAIPLRFIARPDDLTYNALLVMLRHDLEWLPVGEPGHPRCVIGYVTKADILAARRTNLEEEVVRESFLRPSAFQESARLAQEIDHSDASVNGDRET